MATNEFPFLEKYLSPETSGEATEKISSNLSFLDQVLRLELALSLFRKQELLAHADTLTLPFDEILKHAEQYAWLTESEKEEFLAGKIGREISASTADFRFFQEVSSALAGHGGPSLQVPAGLKNFVQHSLNQPKAESSLIIRMKESLRLFAGALSNVHILNAAQQEAFATRSNLAVPQTSQDAGILQFFSSTDEQKILYQVVKDSPESVMLTIKLQGFKPLPRQMRIKRDGRLLNSFPLKEEVAYFPHLTAGAYSIELQDKYGEIIRNVDIDLLDE